MATSTCNFCCGGESSFNKLLLFYVGPSTDEGEGDNDPGYGDEESKATRSKVLSRKAYKR